MGDSVEFECLRLAARQHGVLSRAQALQTGLSPRQIFWRLRTRRWEEVYGSVYRVEGTSCTWRQRLKAVSLWAAHDFAISGEAAAALHKLPGSTSTENTVELSVTRHLRVPRRIVVHQVAALPPKDLASVEGFRVTSVTRTLLDLSATNDRTQLRRRLDHALRHRSTTLDRLEAALDRSERQRGVVLLRDLVAELSGGEAPTESELELRVVELLEAAGFPPPERQRVVCVRDKVRRMDFLMRGTRVVIEADGYAYHSGFDTFEDERRRRRQLVRGGFVVLPWTWTAVRDEPDELIDELRAVLRRELRSGGEVVDHHPVPRRGRRGAGNRGTDSRPPVPDLAGRLAGRY